MEKYIAATDIAPLYGAPSFDGALIDEVLFGMSVDILSKEKNGFIHIVTPYHYEGYTPEYNLMPDIYDWQNSPKWTVWSPYLDIKAEPRVQSITIASCPRGSLLGYLKDENAQSVDGWTMVSLPTINLPQLLRGYVRTQCVSRQITSRDGITETQFREAVVQTAKLYLGTQYRWGGKSPLGIDCSGLTSMCYLLNGSVIFRDADIRDGFEMREISFQEKKKGDLIFFKGHVAMYIGNDKFIHSTAHRKSEGVVLNSFNPASKLYRSDLASGVIKTGSIYPA